MTKATLDTSGTARMQRTSNFAISMWWKTVNIQLSCLTASELIDFIYRPYNITTDVQ